MNTRYSPRHAGFTIMEIILTLCLLGLVGAMLAPYYGASVKSTSALFRLKDHTELEAVIENIVADSKSMITGTPGALSWGNICTNAGASVYDKVTTNLAQYNPSGYPIVLDSTSPSPCAQCVPNQPGNKLSASMAPVLSATVDDQNCALTITLRNTDTGERLSYLFVQGLNY